MLQKKKDQKENKEDGAMLTEAIENMLKQGERMAEVRFVASDVDKMSPKVYQDKELVIWNTIENAIKDSLRPKGKTEDVTLVTTCVEDPSMDLEVADS